MVGPGAIYMTGLTCYFEDNRFINNKDGVTGGTIFIAQVNNQDATHAFDTTAGFNGVEYAKPTAGIYFINCKFVSSKLGYQGSAVSLWNAAMGVIDGWRFEGWSVSYQYEIVVVLMSMDIQHKTQPLI